MGFCMRKEVPSIKKCRLRSKKRHFHLDGSIKREKFRLKEIKALEEEETKLMKELFENE